MCLIGSLKVVLATKALLPVSASGLFCMFLNLGPDVQRSDDTEEKALNRIQVYEDNVTVVTKYYKDEMVHIDGNVAMPEVFKQIETVLDEVFK